MANVWNEIALKIKADYPYLYLITEEESRVLSELEKISNELCFDFTSWSAFLGFSNKNKDAKTSDPLPEIEGFKKGSMSVLLDYHKELVRPDICRQLKDLRTSFIKNKQTIIITAPILSLPKELEKEFTVIDIPMPKAHELAEIFKQVLASKNIAYNDKQAEIFGQSATGLTAEEARLAYNRTTLDVNAITKLDTSLVIEEKRRLIETDGVLQFYDRNISLENVGGLKALKLWLSQRQSAFGASAKEFGLSAPKGLLLLGVQGCGKSLTAKAIAASWKLPLVQFDLGAAFAGRSSPDEVIRKSLKLLEAMSPLVVWIDEIDKGFAGTAKDSSEVQTHRMFGYFITWLQEKQKPVFVVATANKVENLPPELLRKGRFDELFFVDLPDEHERKEILWVHLAKKGFDKSEFKLDELVYLTRNFTGAELEQLVIDALYAAFSDSHKLSLDDLEQSAKKLVPIYITYEEEIKKLRDWAKDRTRQASISNTIKDFFVEENETEEDNL